MTLACTGRSGSIGRHLPPGLLALRTRLERSSAEMLAELERLGERPSAFLHLAALASPAACEADPGRALELNAGGAVRWLRAAAEAGCPCFVQVSTAHVFRPTPEPLWLEPDRPGDADTAYGRSKLEAERELRLAASALGMTLRIARVFSVISKDLRPGFLYAELQRRARDRDLSPIRDHQNVRDFLPVEAVCESLVRIARLPLAVATRDAQVFHVCSGAPRSVRDLAASVFQGHGYSEQDMVGLFPESGQAPDYLISRPSPI